MMLVALAAPPDRARAEGVAEDGFDTAIARRMAAEGRLVIEGRRLDLSSLRPFYAQRGFHPVWFTAGAEAPVPAARDLLGAVQAADAEGLTPADYHPVAIEARLGAAEPARRVELELLLTDALLTYAADIHQGRKKPALISREFDIKPEALDKVATGEAALATADLKGFLKGLAPQTDNYARLRKALAQYRALEKAGGWATVPDGPKMQPGLRSPAVVALRKRLAVTGDLDPKVPVAPVYDSVVEKAVARFQARHGLEADGVVGPGTRAALNMSVAERVNQILANLERERWMPVERGPRHVEVNIPGFRLKAYDHGAVALDMPVIVGTAVRRTPILDSHIISVIFNPSWYVPRKLAREDILPKLQKDPSYLETQGIKVLSDWSGSAKPVDTSRVKWKTVGPDFMNRLRLRQEPGPLNSLGQVKFNIPNDFDVYLHDTPHREKFDKTVRTFSSGCVRVGDPMALAAFLLQDMPEWPLQRRQEVLEAGKTRMVVLSKAVPVRLLYQTAWVDDLGVAHFHEDIYGRDAELLKAVDRTPVVPPKVANLPD